MLGSNILGDAEDRTTNTSNNANNNNSSSKQQHNALESSGSCRMRRVASHALLDFCEDDLLSPKEISLHAGSPDLLYSYGVCSLQGQRTHMEDCLLVLDLSDKPQFLHCSRAVLMGVFDGHAGHEAAEHLRANFLPHFLASKDIACQNWSGALREALLACEDELIAALYPSGSTALVALMVDSGLHLANVGDCRAVVCDDGEARALTRDHKPGSNTMEKERLETAGAQLTVDGYLQLTTESGQCGDIMLSRALGGAPIKASASSAALLSMHSLSNGSSCASLLAPSPSKNSLDYDPSDDGGNSFRTRSQGGQPPAQSRTSDSTTRSSAQLRTTDNTTCTSDRVAIGTRVSVNKLSPRIMSDSGAVGTTLSDRGAIGNNLLSPSSSGGTLSIARSSARSAGPEGARRPLQLSVVDGPLGGLLSPKGSVANLWMSSTNGASSSNANRNGASSPHPNKFGASFAHPSAIGASAPHPHMSTAAFTLMYDLDTPRFSTSDGMLGGSGGAVPIIIPDPDLFQYAIHEDSEFVILASDGIWDTVSNTAAVTRVRRWLADGCTPDAAAALLVDYAFKMKSDDNATALILRFSSRTLVLPGRNPNSALHRSKSTAFALLPEGTLSSQPCAGSGATQHVGPSNSTQPSCTSSAAQQLGRSLMPPPWQGQASNLLNTAAPGGGQAVQGPAGCSGDAGGSGGVGGAATGVESVRTLQAAAAVGVDTILTSHSHTEDTLIIWSRAESPATPAAVASPSIAVPLPFLRVSLPTAAAAVSSSPWAAIAAAVPSLTTVLQSLPVPSTAAAAAVSLLSMAAASQSTAAKTAAAATIAAAAAAVSSSTMAMATVWPAPCVDSFVSISSGGASSVNGMSGAHGGASGTHGGLNGLTSVSCGGAAAGSELGSFNAASSCIGGTLASCSGNNGATNGRHSNGVRGLRDASGETFTSCSGSGGVANGCDSNVGETLAPSGGNNGANNGCRSHGVSNTNGSSDVHGTSGETHASCSGSNGLTNGCRCCDVSRANGVDSTTGETLASCSGSGGVANGCDTDVEETLVSCCGNNGCHSNGASSAHGVHTQQAV